jgi:hypothetical protein
MTACGATRAAAEIAARRIASTTHFLSAPTRHGHAAGQDLPSAPGWSAGANDPTERLSQGTTHARRGSRRRSRRTHGKRCIPPTIAIAQAAPKTATKIASPRSNARPKPITASRERATSSHERGATSTHCLRIEREVSKRPGPPGLAAGSVHSIPLHVGRGTEWVVHATGAIVGRRARDEFA